MDFQYQSEKMMESTKDFFSSNSLVSHIVFLILVIIAFLLLLRLGSSIIAYFINPKPNVVLINGMRNGQNQLIISTNPQVEKSIPILRSRDQRNGIQFTWSAWIFINADQRNTSYSHIFHRGSNQVEKVTNIAQPSNGPGLYISPSNFPQSAEVSLLVRMNVFNNINLGTTQPNIACVNAAESYCLYRVDSNNDSNNDCIKKHIESCGSDKTSGDDYGNAPNIFDDINISEIPVNKWISVIIRCENNNILDIYINGRIVKRHTLSGVAHQNYGDVYVSMNGGFNGYISELKYYNYAIGTTEIDSIVSNGPNLNIEGKDLKSSKPYYLANNWYYDEIDPGVIGYN